jgi:hypothetical protein
MVSQEPLQIGRFNCMVDGAGYEDRSRLRYFISVPAGNSNGADARSSSSEPSTRHLFVRQQIAVINSI